MESIIVYTDWFFSAISAINTAYGFLIILSLRDIVVKNTTEPQYPPQASSDRYATDLNHRARL